MVRTWILSCLTCALLCGLSSSILAGAYSIHELQGYGNEYDKWHSEACDINDKGWIIGNISNDADGAVGAGMWRNYEDALTDMEEAYGIIWPGGLNDDGAVAGASNYNGSTVATIWFPTGVCKVLTEALGSIDSRAADVNNAGEVIGSCTILNEDLIESWALYWDSDGAVTKIHGSSAGQCVTSAISSTGTVVGFSLESSGSERDYRAFTWCTRTGYAQLALLPGTSASYAYGINDKGQIVGACDNHAVMWKADGSVVDLGEGRSAVAYGINNYGYIVGSYDDVGVVWTPDKTVMALDTNSCLLSSATAINDLGQIAGHVTLEGDVTRAVLWQPVPEPASLLALAAGIAGLVIRRRR